MTQADDEGMYTCEANNPAGLEKKSFRLKVLSKSQIVDYGWPITIEVIFGGK